MADSVVSIKRYGVEDVYDLSMAQPHTNFVANGIIVHNCGKAKVAIDLATWRYREGQIKRVLVVCPNSVLPQWVVELEKHGHDDFKKHSVLSGSSKDKLKQCKDLLESRFTGFILVNIDALLHMYPGLMDLQGSKHSLFDQMIIDESSTIKRAASKRSKVAWKLGGTCVYRNILTGTPVTQSLEDIFSQYRFLKFDVFGIYSTAFRSQYLVLGGFEQRQIVGYRNINDALKKIYKYSIRLTKDRCLDLPPKIYETRYAKMDEVTSRKYKELEKECVVEFDKATILAPLVMTKIIKLSQITGGFIYEADDAGKRVATHHMAKPAKLDVLEEILDESPGRKFIIWARFTEEINIIQGLLSKLGIKHVMISGSVDRRIAVRKFGSSRRTQQFSASWGRWQRQDWA